MIGTPDELKFVLAAEEQDLVQAMKNSGTAVDQLQKKVEKLNATTAGGGRGKSAGPASDRQINKALGQDTAGDFLELFGIGEQGLATLKTAGITVAALNAAMSVTTNIFKGLAEGKDASEVWTDIAKGIPILGSIADAADKAGKAIGDYLYGLKELQEQANREEKGIKDQRKVLGDVEGEVKAARDRAFVGGADDPEFARAQLEARDKIAKVEEQRKALGKLGESGETKKALDELRNRALTELQQAQIKSEDAARKRAQSDYDKQQEKERKAQEDAQRAKADEEKKAGETRDRINKQLMGGSASVLGDIDQLKMSMAEKQLQDQLNIGRQTRTGALAETTGFGTANQLASRERASANPMLKLMQDAEKRDERKLKALETLAAQANAGEVSLVVFN
jgi:hypothetical protein